MSPLSAPPPPSALGCYPLQAIATGLPGCPLPCRDVANPSSPAWKHITIPFPAHPPPLFSLQAVASGLLPPPVQHQKQDGVEWCEFAPLTTQQRQQRQQQGLYMRPIVWFRCVWLCGGALANARGGGGGCEWHPDVLAFALFFSTEQCMYPGQTSNWAIASHARVLHVCLMCMCAMCLAMAILVCALLLVPCSPLL